jgi:pyruvate/2-oxoglutarate/acetoin dehydrogenase E1 component
LIALTYIDQIIENVNLVTAKCGPILLYGENIDTGSRIGGLARGLTVNPAGRIQNVGNCELTHCGVGLGMLLDGGQAVLFVKQLDFMLLGLDQICNTFNFIRAYLPKKDWGSFTIFSIICDQGYQGPQSSLNGAGDFASLANLPVYCLNTVEESSRIIQGNLASPGFRIICLSQRLLGQPALQLTAEWASADNSLFRYKSGSDATIVSFNFALRDTLDIHTKLSDVDLHCDVFHMNFIPATDLEPILESCRRTGKLILVDDSKTVTKFGDMVVANICSIGITVKLLTYNRRGCTDYEYGANEDRMLIDAEKAVAFVKRPRESHQF